MCVLSDDWDGPYVQVDGTAEVLDMPAALDGLVEYFRCISGEHLDWDEYREAMIRAEQVADPHRHPAVGTGRHRRVPSRSPQLLVRPPTRQRRRGRAARSSLRNGRVATAVLQPHSPP
jgi:hypothetical protein